MSPRNLLTGVSKKIRHSKNLVRQFLQLVNEKDQTYFPNAPQKNRWTIWRENLVWIIRHKELNRYYYIYGMDRKHTDVAKHVLPYRTFTKIRDRGNLRPEGMNFNYACILRDKFVFGQFLTSLHFPTPKNVALINNSSITWLDTMQTVPLTDLVDGPPICLNAFCKKLMG